METERFSEKSVNLSSDYTAVKLISTLHEDIGLFILVYKTHWQVTAVTHQIFQQNGTKAPADLAIYVLNCTFRLVLKWHRP